MPNGGLPFFKYFDETDKVIYPSGAKYPTLWPANCVLSDETKEQIKTNFSNYFVNNARPQYWLSRFWNLITREQDKWLKLLESENALRPEDAIYSYYMTGKSSFLSEGEVKEGLEQSTDIRSTDTGYLSDTPEGSVSDIQNYMSNATKQDTESNNSLLSNTNTMTTGNGTQTLTRKGNIGVMTSAQIISGYRGAVKWCAYDDVIFPELEQLFVMIWEGDEDFGYLYTAD